MVISLVAVGQQLTAGVLNSLIRGVNGQALTGIVPASAVGGSVGATGRVAFTSANPVSLNGVFTTNYDNYKIILDVSSRSTQATVAFRLRANGADITSATYGSVRGTDQATTRTVLGVTAATSVPIDNTPAVIPITLDASIDVYGPALTGGTSFISTAATYDATNGATQHQVSGRATATAAADGFTIFTSSAALTGTVRVYGYNNLN